MAGGGAVAQQAQPGGYGYGDHMMGWGGWFAGPIMMLVGLAILIGFVVLVVRLMVGGPSGNSYGRSSGGPPADSAMAILRERFARGEISHEEYVAMKRHLDA
ncbi:MAG: SHOCT domain-containing protein [Alphaproteobacteria bacterium]|nr:SHOCT domain-containing protein [Alphaproteobacteria bacterium]MCB9930824.1 SHOCT domain-containing protein [Alphaproteobacteria bacterium]